MSGENKRNSHINEPIAEFVEKLKQQIEAEKRGEEKRGEEDIEETGESMALLYEKVRNLIEYKDDHLIKRNAIERILKRNLLIELRRENFTEQFLEELAMSGYLEKGEVGEKLETRVSEVISKYQKASGAISGYETKRWLVGMASCEIEEILFPNPSRFALARAMYETVKEKIEIRGARKSSGGGKNIQIFLAVVRSIAKPDNAMLNFVLFKLYLPQWFKEDVSDRELAGMLSGLPALIHSIQAKIASPVSVKIGVALRKYAVYFNIFYEAALQNISKIEKILGNPDSLNFAVQLSASEVYDREMKKFWKRVKRSLVFLVITKIFLAVAVEYPFDLYIVGQVRAIPIIINLFLPPIYLLILSTTIRRPSDQNSALIAKGVEEIAYGREKKPIAEIRLQEIETFSDWALNLFFILTYGISFGLVIWILNILHFNWLGILIFLFLFSVINFFNALVRQPVRELLVAREKEGMVGMLIDTLSMPFVRIGKWMSINFSRVNVFIFLFDVIIEAPFKVVVRFIREWAGFIRRKKEEVI
ncbi:MAG: hypothetical protein A2359_04630 [Candidatus Moranbacteria bacterium RIFOXYB1_FULL_43_19]|nr:MAG: hypothetical protein A2359_04630 [Candidatus Moranbacteria bacterium RIFOXYB1_FULL_43_19]OGI29016.1 MAG: hypothetical protein A2184_04895 [Candidatus Moranbacteria bacterium RIFOXYA1_FULL_44_7]OGI33893.1 MAG: hypothetical protein A2420_01735 [Candidatus Moranbacteria bacterium RIFOXYC1_FULL_44_13]OGI38299.1 MAG: hypothetical protein A2612_03750 [Candidatus Moranbacteria bacterium RIFOXYD1_FULL_44_12]